VIGPSATIGDNAIISESVIRNSIVSESAQVYRALLNDSLVGNNAVVEGTFQCINIGDSSEIKFH
jgi:glucose-1-phosphate thymidylyltransferase